MIKLMTAAALAISLASGAALAQATKPADTAVSAADAAVVAKFKAEDKNANGTLEGAELDTHKTNLVKIDTNSDGKISQAEFVAASKAGLVK